MRAIWFFYEYKWLFKIFLITFILEEFDLLVLSIWIRYWLSTESTKEANCSILSKHSRKKWWDANRKSSNSPDAAVEIAMVIGQNWTSRQVDLYPLLLQSYIYQVLQTLILFSCNHNELWPKSLYRSCTERCLQ